MFDNLWQALGTLGTVAFAVTVVGWAIKRPESKRLPLWSWPVLVFASVTLTIGNTGWIRSYLLLVTGGVAVVAIIIGAPQLVGAVRDLRQPPTPPVLEPSARARVQRPEQMGLDNWKAGHESFDGEEGVTPGVLLWVRSTDVSSLDSISCEVQNPDGDISHRNRLSRRSSGGRHEAAYPNDFSGSPPLIDGDYTVVWKVTYAVVRRDRFHVRDGSLEA